MKACFLSFLFILGLLLIPQSVSAQDFDFQISRYPELIKCISEEKSPNGVGWTAKCEGSDAYLRRMYKCIEALPSTSEVWRSCVTSDTVSGESIQVPITVCATEFARSICSDADGVTKIQQLLYGDSVACSIECSDNYIDTHPNADEVMGLKRLMTMRVGVNRCSQLFAQEVTKINNGTRDELIKNTCGNYSEGECLKDVFNIIKSDINGANGNLCSDVVDQPSEQQVKEAISSRYNSGILVLATPNQEVARSTIRNIITSCVQNSSGEYMNNGSVSCVGHINCIRTKLREETPADNPIWSCVNQNPTGIQTCLTKFARFVANDYGYWIDTLPDEILLQPRNSNETVRHCGDYTTVKIMQESIESRLISTVITEQSHFYLQKQQERQLLSDVEDDESALDDGAPESTLDVIVLEEAYENLTCGFAGSDNKQCCTNTIADFNPTRTNLESQCILPNPIVGGCFLDTTTISNPIMSLVQRTSGMQIENLSRFAELSGGLPACFVGTASSDDPTDPSCICNPNKGTEMCYRYIKDKERNGTTTWSEFKPYNDCLLCLQDNHSKLAGESLSMYTAFGCIETSIAGVTGFIFGTGLGIAGTVALFCIMVAGVQMQISQGNPEQLQKAQGLMTSCITGLIVVIFSVIILQIIGVEILKIPGWG